MQDYILRRGDIENLQGEEKTHFLNPNAVRLNKSLGDATGLTGLGVHLIDVAPGHETTEYHVHHYEDECVYILEGNATVVIGEQEYSVSAGDFIGYRAGGLPHTMINSGAGMLRCLVAGQRLAHDVSDYPKLNRRLYRNKGAPMNLANIVDLIDPATGKPPQSL